MDAPQEPSALSGRHLVDGQWVASDATFMSAPLSAVPHAVSAGSDALVDRACQAAERAFWRTANLPAEQRAKFLRAMADAIDADSAAIVAVASAETGLAAARLASERGRTTNQLRLFADHIVKGDYLDRRHDPALPDRSPQPRPDLKLVQRPMGPVAVFGASNFPLAFSVAGGDTAAALAAGCPVVVKGHEAHPGTSELVARAILTALVACQMPAGAFALVHGGSQAVGQALVTHPLIKAVGFTGSARGGRALFDLCAQRPEPIPFFGELGSVNPVFVLPGALNVRAVDIGRGWAASLTLGVGQFCTAPGIVILVDGSQADAFSAAAERALKEVVAAPMLTEGIADAYRRGAGVMASKTGVRVVLASPSDGRSGAPVLLETDARTFVADRALREEVFGPLGLIVRARSGDEVVEIARSFEGQLTATVHLEGSDGVLARTLMPILERKAGRLIANGFPTGVEVADAMVHGGPYPASTNFGATSVGTLSIRRFLRPVCYQDMPGTLLPAELSGDGGGEDGETGSAADAAMFALRFSAVRR